MNRSGDSRPRVGWRQRARASNPDDRAAVEVDDGLVVGEDFVAFQRAPKVVLQLQRGDGDLVHVAAEHLVAGAPRRLGPVHRGVRVPQHVLGALVAGAGQRDSDADAGEHLVVAHLQWGRELLVDAVGDAGRVRLAGDVVQQHGELVAAHARQRIAGADAALQPAGDAHQQLVAGLVPQAVVDGLEAVEVQIQHRERRVTHRAPRAVEEVLQAIEEQRAVGQVRELIVKSAVLQLLFGRLAVGDVARDSERAHDVADAVAQRQLGRRDPPHLAVRQRLFLFDVHQRLPGADDLLLVTPGLRRVLIGEKVEVGPPDGLRLGSQLRTAAPHTG